MLNVIFPSAAAAPIAGEVYRHSEQTTPDVKTEDIRAIETKVPQAATANNEYLQSQYCFMPAQIKYYGTEKTKNLALAKSSN